ncbi:MAG TPA: L,D-transpeptidase [Thermoanaerobaculia bacterium]|nr:L,D-transpeptidase [Thermoanaerobaculia bacterium]
MDRILGLLASWAFFVLALGLAAFAAASEWINIRDSRRLDRVEVIDRMIAERNGSKAQRLRNDAERRTAEIDALKNRIAATSIESEPSDSAQTIIVSTAENKVTVRRGTNVELEAVCSTGKGTTLAIDGETLVFDTPIGKFKVVSKEENPVWVPPDWHYVEQARKAGKRVVRLTRGNSIDADTGGPAIQAKRGFLGLFGGQDGSKRVLHVRGNRVVVDEYGSERELPPGEMIYAGGAVVIPPIGTPQREFKDVLGHYRLNLGDGYAIHGTQETDKLGQSVSHGCVRLADNDIARLYAMANVGDEVIIY